MPFDPARAPRLVAWEVTRACDLACLHCRAVAQPYADPRQLSTDEAFRLVDDIAAFGEPVILILTGGGPAEAAGYLQCRRAGQPLRPPRRDVAERDPRRAAAWLQF